MLFVEEKQLPHDDDDCQNILKVNTGSNFRDMEQVQHLSFTQTIFSCFNLKSRGMRGTRKHHFRFTFGISEDCFFFFTSAEVIITTECLSADYIF